MFSFCKYAAFILPSLKRVANIRILGRRATCGYRQSARYVKAASSSSIQKRQNASAPLNPSATARYVRQPPSLKGAAPDVTFHYVLNLKDSLYEI
jgi:hypothetical protein